MKDIVIAGAGIMGRLLAWQLARDGHRVRVIDPAADAADPRAAAFTAEVLMVLSARDTRSSPAAAAARGAAGILDAVPTLERAKEILAPAKRAPRARSADMAMVDMLRWTERSRGRRLCAPMRLSGGEARLLEWLRNVIEETSKKRVAQPQLCWAKFANSITISIREKYVL